MAMAAAAADPGRAERSSTSITDDSRKASALYKVAQTVAAADPGLAERLSTTPSA